jgi:hypothetical protein
MMDFEQRVADAVDEIEVWELLAMSAITTAEHAQADASLQQARSELDELLRLRS